MPLNPPGGIALVLHCHLPFVREPGYEYFLEENWYFEALFETYLPLLSAFGELREKGVPFRLTLSVSPTLAAMCSDPLLQKRALRYVDQLIGMNRKAGKGKADLAPAVEMYARKLARYREEFLGRHRGNILEGFRDFRGSGHLELITCAATHGFLPLLGMREGAVRAQVRTAVRAHREAFGEAPRGFWLPECAYEPGQEKILRDEGLDYFFVETHGLLQAAPRPKYGVFAPALSPGGPAFFGRDPESSKQVWSSKEGYPGDPLYREFYRDAGFDLPEAELHPYLQPEGIRRFTGLKYYRVTGPGDRKEPYDPAGASARAREHAVDFLARRRAQAAEASQWMDRPPLVTAMYDAELFGHWWYEGPEFLQALFEENRGGALEFLTPSDYLDRHPDNQATQPVFSSWGAGGYAGFWLNGANDWIYPLLNRAYDEMAALVEAHPAAAGERARALHQAARELLLAQASDWAFMMKAGHYRSYAEKRVRTHLSRFYQLADQVRRGRIQRRFLADLEEKDNLFPWMDYRVFAPPA